MHLYWGMSVSGQCIFIIDAMHSVINIFHTRIYVAPSNKIYLFNSIFDLIVTANTQGTAANHNNNKKLVLHCVCVLIIFHRVQMEAASLQIKICIPFGGSRPKDFVCAA